MLQQMRQFSKSWISSLFLGVLSLSFVAWGIGDVFRGNTSTAVATVGGTAVEQTIFQRDYTNFLRNQGKDITPDQAQRMHLGSILLQNSIAQTAMDNMVRNLGLTVSDDAVSMQIRAIPAFAGLTGTFDRGVFQQKINRIGYSEQGFIEAVRRDTARSQLVHAAEAGFLLPDGYARALFAYYTEIRAAQYVTVDAKSLPPIAPPPDAVLAAYVNAHPDKFSTPEYRNVSYAQLGVNDISGSISVTDEQIKTAYENDKSKYVILEKRQLEQLIFPTQGEAETARAKLAAGATFDQIAFERGEKPSDTALGELTSADLDAAQAGPVFALAAGGITQPLKTIAGWALFHVVKITPGKVTTLDQAKEEIRKDLIQQLAASKLADIANTYTDAASGGATLDEAAKKVGMHTGHALAMDAKGLAPDGSKAAVPDDPEFREQVFKSEVGEDNDPFPAKSGNYYVIAVNGIVPPKVKPLDQVRTDALAAWTAEQRVIQIQKKAEELAALANKSQSLETAAKTIGAAVQSSPALMHATSDATFSASLVGALFAAAPGATVFAPKGDGNGYVVARVSGIFHPRPPLGDPQYIEGVRMISNTAAQDIGELMSMAARDRQGVTINQKMLDTVVGGGSEGQ